MLKVRLNLKFTPQCLSQPFVFFLLPILRQRKKIFFKVRLHFSRGIEFCFLKAAREEKQLSDKDVAVFYSALFRFISYGTHPLGHKRGIHMVHGDKHEVPKVFASIALQISRTISIFVKQPKLVLLNGFDALLSNKMIDTKYLFGTKTNLACHNCFSIKHLASPFSIVIIIKFIAVEAHLIFHAYRKAKKRLRLDTFICRDSNIVSLC